MKFKLLLLACFTFLNYFLANAGDTPIAGEGETKKADVAGGIYHNETKKPLNSVTVTAYSSAKRGQVVLSDASGSFSIDDLKPGVYKFVFEKDGFKKVIQEKTILRSDEGHQLTILMEEHAAFNFTPGASHFFDF